MLGVEDYRCYTRVARNVACTLILGGSCLLNARADQAEYRAIVEARIEEVVVVASRKSFYTKITENAHKLVDMPGALGDPLSALSALPGVITPNNSVEPSVRGSSPNDNRYYVDGVPVAYIFHRFNTSIFDENIIQDFQLYSAGFGAEYANATGAVFDIRLRDPKNQPIKTKVTLSLLRAGIFIEGKVRGESAFYLSARKGLIQFFLPEQERANDEGVRVVNAPADSDHQFKYVAHVGDSDQITISSAGAADAASAELTDLASLIQENPDFIGDASIRRRFHSQSVNWLHRFQAGAYVNINVSQYYDREKIRWGDGYFSDAQVNNRLLKWHASPYSSPRYAMEIGGELGLDRLQFATRSVLFICSEFEAECQSGRRGITAKTFDIDSRQSVAYLKNVWQIVPETRIEMGLQYQQNNYTDEGFLHPRLAASWEPTRHMTVRTAFGRYNRFPDVETILPEIGNPYLDSPVADHYTLGLQQELLHDWEWSIEGYYKKLRNLPLALSENDQDGGNFYSNDVDGSAAGFEFLLNKNRGGNWYGWISLSYSNSFRQNRRTQESRRYFLDTPLVFNMVGQYEFDSNKWKAGFRFTSKSGEAYTNIIGIRRNPIFPERYLPVYSRAYASRLPNFARLDVRAERPVLLFGIDGLLFVDILNAANRKNVTERALDYERVNATGELHVEDDTDLGRFVSIGLTLSF